MMILPLVNISVNVGSTSNPFGAIPIDQAVEQTINKDTATPCGTKGFSLKPQALQKFYMTVEYRSMFLDNLQEMTGISTSSLNHADLGKARIAKGEKEVCIIEDQLSENWINPFSSTMSDIVSISTRKAPSETIS